MQGVKKASVRSYLRLSSCSALSVAMLRYNPRCVESRSDWHTLLGLRPQSKVVDKNTLGLATSEWHPRSGLRLHIIILGRAK